MIKRKHSKVALYGFVSKFLRILIAPLSLIVIANNLDNEKLAYYYIFLSIIAMQQLMELGIGNVMKQYISHAFAKNQKDKKVVEYIKLTQRVFLIIGLLNLTIINICGILFLSSKDTDIEWFWAWELLVISTFIQIQIVPKQITIEATQNQILFQKSNIIAGLISSLVLLVCIYSGLELFSLGISTLSMCTALFIIINDEFKLKIKNKITIKYKEVFDDIKDYFYKVSIVWALGYVFWNSFSIITFVYLEPKVAGPIMFSIAILRSILSIAEGILQSQTTLFAHWISKKKYLKASITFRNYFLITFTLLVFGYFCVAIYIVNFESTDIAKKIVDLDTFLFLSIFYTSVFVKNSFSNFVRCYKLEKFVKVAFLEALIIPVVFSYEIYKDADVIFILPSIVIFILTIITYNMSKKYLRYK